MIQETFIALPIVVTITGGSAGEVSLAWRHLSLLIEQAIAARQSPESQQEISNGSSNPPDRSGSSKGDDSW